MRSIVPSNVVSRVRYNLRRYGAKVTMSKVATLARQSIYVDESHVWYELPLGPDRPRGGRLPGLSLIQASVRDVPLLDQLPTISPSEAKQRMEAGRELWLVLKGQQPVFACWVYRGSVEVVAARRGQITLPPETVLFEDSVSSLAYRGRGIALAAWPKIADHLEQTGITTIITKVEESLVEAQRAFVKSGFREIATTHLQRIGPCKRSTIRVGDGATASWLAEQLTR
jgi:hypothetical protein